MTMTPFAPANLFLNLNACKPFALFDTTTRADFMKPTFRKSAFRLPWLQRKECFRR
jgi:hypothetical protein